jgi:hypothetical protein
MKIVLLLSDLVFLFLLSVHLNPIHCNENSSIAIKLSFLFSIQCNPIHCNENSLTAIKLSFFFYQFTWVLFIVMKIVLLLSDLAFFHYQFIVILFIVMKGVFLLQSNLVFLLPIHWNPIHCNENSSIAIKLCFLFSIQCNPFLCNENSFTVHCQNSPYRDFPDWQFCGSNASRKERTFYWAAFRRI